jgi:hypothetical protein
LTFLDGGVLTEDDETMETKISFTGHMAIAYHSRNRECQIAYYEKDNFRNKT